MTNIKSILIIIDNQVGFNTTEYTKLVGKKIVELSNKNYFDYIIATQYINDEKLKTNLFTRLQNWHFLKTEAEYRYVDNLKFDYSLTKHTYTCVNLELLTRLKIANNNQLPPCVFVVGMDTECCVLQSCVGLFENGIIPILLQNYVASNSGEIASERGIKLFERLVSKKAIIEKEIESRENVRKIIESFQPNF